MRVILAFTLLNSVRNNKEFEMSPMYGYEVHPNHADHREFVEVVFSDSTKPKVKDELEIVDNVDENEIMETAIDNPCYLSHSAPSSRKLVSISLDF